MAEAGPSSRAGDGIVIAHRRVTKACETCRQRRRRCDGLRPCSTCVKGGVAESCHFRVKSRPKRSLLAANNTELAGSRVNPIAQVEEYLQEWANAKGAGCRAVNLELPFQTALTERLLSPEPDLPGDQPVWRELLHTFSIKFEHHRKLMLQGQLEDLFETFLHRPHFLHPDEMALVLAALALGRQAETELAGSDGNDLGEEIAYFRLALSAIDGSEVATHTSVRALHLLHLFAIFTGGPQEVTYILDIMTQHCRLLGAHRRSTASLYSSQEEIGRLFYLSLYKDTWFTTLFPDKQLAFPLGEFEHTWVERQDQSGSSGYEEDPLFVELTLLETEAVKMIQSGSISSEEMCELETRLASWQIDLRECERRKALMSGYATIRFHWLRLLLRTPWAMDDNQLMASLSILSGSSASILRCYDRLSATRYFRPMWAEVRRVTTAAYVQLYCLIKGEVSALEFEPVASLASRLLERLAQGNSAASHVLLAWTDLRGSVDLASRTLSSETRNETAIGRPAFSPFDYTLPPEHSLW